MKILVVDDHAVIRKGVSRPLSALNDAVVVEASSESEALRLRHSEAPDIIILDLSLPEKGGMGLLTQLLAADPAVRILVFSMYTLPVYVARALKAGAKGYVSKAASAEEFLGAVRELINGRTYIEQDLTSDLIGVLSQQESGTNLSGREVEIMRLLASGKDFSRVAAELGVSYKTVSNACTTIKRKLLLEKNERSYSRCDYILMLGCRQL